MALTAEQRETRKQGLGGSDIAVILGLSPWKTPLELYLEKTGELPEPDLSANEAVHFGNVLEDVVADEYARRTGEKVRRNNQTLYHSTHPFLLGHLDREVVGKRKVLEIKTASGSQRSQWGEPETDQVPEYYLVQVAHYMALRDYDSADVAVLFDGREFVRYTVGRDPELEKMIIDAAVSFWRGNVLARVAPAPAYDHPSTVALLQRRYPGTNGATVSLDHVEHWHRVYRDCQERIKTYSAAADAAKAHLLAEMGEAAKGVIPGFGGYTRKVVQRKAYSVEASEYVDFRFLATLRME